MTAHTLGSLFDGIGVFPLAAAYHGIRPVWASEIEKQPISITMRHFPGMAHVGDITKLDGGAIPPVDVITFGSPCQNLSQIGFREGLAGEKSSLFYEAIRIINEMREATNGRYPTFAVWENVEGAFSSSGGNDFRAVLGAFANTEMPVPATGWANAGMVCGGSPDFAWRLLDSKHFRCAQRRRRIFLVADYRGQRAAQILFSPTHLHEIIEHGEEGGLPDAPGAGSDICQTGRQAPEVYALQMRKMRGGVQYRDTRMFLSAVGSPGRPCPTLLAGDQQLIAVHYPDDPEKDCLRRLTPTESETLMGLPVGWTRYGHDGQKISDSARYRALGNSIVLQCAEYVMHGIAQALQEEKEVFNV